MYCKLFSHVDTVFSEWSNSNFVKDNVLQLNQNIFIILESVIQQIVIFSFVHIIFSGIIGATIKMEMVIGIQFLGILPKAEATWMSDIALN